MKVQILKELKELFLGKLGIAVVIAYCIIMNVMLWVWPTWSYLSYGFGSLDLYFRTSSYVLIFVIPGLSAGLLAKEISNGTVDLLGSLPIGWKKIIGSKFISGMVVVLVLMVLTIPSIKVLHELDITNQGYEWSQLFGSYLGLILTGGFVLSLGFFVSSLVNSDIISFIITVVLAYLAFDGLSILSNIESLPENIADLLSYMSIQYHVSNFSRGLITLSNMVYMTSLIVVFILMSVRTIESKMV